MKSLKLHFDDPSKVKKCLKELKKQSPVSFEAKDDVLEERHWKTLPEAINVKKVIRLDFKTDEDCMTFMNSGTHDIYQKYSS